ncbi:hypothetical protein GT360_04545 [Vibrio astriarenae]|uniref:AAA family ATPase n=1 Tax=Vibrio astriarenae TaxID=1481923 RepID=A0A7Z2T239_9VIBR|nr:FimV/HubP family polar landmark protein [Vibrio astriarenae]QIA62827.1 hypothetical protein GT360_04545 [Vibrio astriarenae]
MRLIFQRLCLPLLLVVATGASYVSADTIRVKGPNGEVSSSPQYSQPINRNTPISEPSRFYGPVGEEETLWQIASRFRPNNRITTQQMLLAIYQVNPRAFEDQNIHSLIPGSNLRIPSLAQAQSVTTEQAVRVMATHQKRLQPTPVLTPTRPRLPASDAPQTEQVSSEPEIKAVSEPTVPAQPQPESEPDKVDAQALEEVKQEPQEVSRLKEELEVSESELLALEERNHQLRLMLSEVQNELGSLREEVSDEQRIRDEVEKMLQAERVRIADEQRLKPSLVDQLAATPWLLALLASIPGLLLVLIVVSLLNRRRNSDEAESPSQQDINVQTLATADEVPSLESDDLDDDLLLGDDLFDDDSLASDDSDNAEDTQEPLQEDIFADLSDDDGLDLNLDDDDGLFDALDDSDIDAELDDIAMSSNGISVSFDEKALGLEEMERALDQASLDEDGDSGFDLSDDDDFDSLLSNEEALEGGSLDQSMLDELLLDIDEQGGDDSLVSLEDELGLDIEQPKEQKEPTAEYALDDDSFDEFDLEESTGLLDDFIEQQDEGSASSEIAEDSVDLLDELVGASDDDLDLSTSEQMLDELLTEHDMDSGQEDELSDGTELFDELLEIEQASETASLKSIDGNVDPDELLAEFSFDDSNLSQDKERAEDQDIDDLLAEVAEQHSKEPEPPFNRDDFVDDIDSISLDKDPLLSGGDWDSLSERDSSSAEQRSEQDTSKAEENEFGLPQDDDWLFESNEPEQDSTKQPLSLDEALFPEFTEEDTAASFDETVELEEQPEAQAEEQPFALDDELFPEFTEEDAAASFDEPEPQTESQAVEEPLSLDDELFHEFTEEDAAVSFDEPVEPELQPESQAVEKPLSLDDELFPEFTEEDAAASFDEPVKPELQPEPQAVEEPLLLDDELLPEFTEEDAAASFDEPGEPELQPEPQAVEEPLSLNDELLPEFTEEDAAASFDEPELTTELQATEESLSLADELLPEFTEEDAAASLEQPNEPLATAEQSHSDDFIDPSMAVDPENVDEQNALFDLFQSGEVTSESAQSIDEGVLNDWLDESNDSVTFDQSMFSPEKADSAGMDIDSMLEMGGEDWDGFQRPDENLADIPADEQQVWDSNNQPEQAKIADDDWSQQHDFNPKDAQYKTIEELMAEVDSEVELTPDEEELNLNVGLDEFPDVIGNVDFEDVDANSEASGKIDLAKIYLEMNDSQGAIKLLEEAIVDGNDDIRREAKSLIDKIRA